MCTTTYSRWTFAGAYMTWTHVPMQCMLDAYVNAPEFLSTCSSQLAQSTPVLWIHAQHASMVNPWRILVNPCASCTWIAEPHFAQDAARKNALPRVSMLNDVSELRCERGVHSTPYPQAMPFYALPAGPCGTASMGRQLVHRRDRGKQ